MSIIATELNILSHSECISFERRAQMEGIPLFGVPELLPDGRWRLIVGTGPVIRKIPDGRIRVNSGKRGVPIVVTI